MFSMLATVCCGWALTACIPKAVVVEDEVPTVAAAPVKKPAEAPKTQDAGGGPGLRQPKLRIGDLTSLPTATEMRSTEPSAGQGGGGLPVVPERPAPR